MLGEQEEEAERGTAGAWRVLLLHAEGTYALESDSAPPRQSQNREPPYLFSSHQINNNILL